MIHLKYNMYRSLLSPPPPPQQTVSSLCPVHSAPSSFFSVSHPTGLFQMSTFNCHCYPSSYFVVSTSDITLITCITSYWSQFADGRYIWSTCTSTFLLFIFQLLSSNSNSTLPGSFFTTSILQSVTSYYILVAYIPCPLSHFKFHSSYLKQLLAIFHTPVWVLVRMKFWVKGKVLLASWNLTLPLVTTRTDVWLSVSSAEILSTSVILC